MFWLIIRLLILLTVLAPPSFRAQPAQLTMLGLYTCFDLLWLVQRSLARLRIPAELFFSGLLGMTLAALLAAGPLASLALFWPSLMLRLEKNGTARIQQQRVVLICCQWVLGGAYALQLQNLSAFYLAPSLLGLLQLNPGRLARVANLAALIWSLGMVAEVFASGMPTARDEQLARSAILMTFPLLGLRFVNRGGSNV
ncbi:hypothetical protein JST97_16080 [bacterium]|nr:hypothetical protein [bacterium]